LAPHSVLRVFLKSGAPAWRDQRKRNLARRCGLTDTGKAQVAEVGRNYSGAFNPIKSVVPSPVHQTVVTVRSTIPD
jgi:broad specificity phosphatase PhoE